MGSVASIIDKSETFIWAYSLILWAPEVATLAFEGNQDSCGPLGLVGRFGEIWQVRAGVKGFRDRAAEVVEVIPVGVGIGVAVYKAGLD